jgi:hypothetical protein
MTVPIDPTPATESSAVMAATTIDAIAVQLRAVLETLQTIVPDLLTFDARQIKRVMASAKFGVQSIVPTIAIATTVPRVKDRNLFDVQAGQLALQFRDQIVPLAMQFVKFADDIQYTSDNLLAVSAVEALQTYRWAQHAARQPDGAELHSYVAEMARAMKKTMNHRGRLVAFVNSLHDSRASRRAIDPQMTQMYAEKIVLNLRSICVICVSITRSTHRSNSPPALSILSGVMPPTLPLYPR